MSFLIPIISAILFRLGGWEKGNKWFRWAGIGLFIAAIYVITRHSWMPLLCIPIYFIVTNALSYGENNWLRKTFGRDCSWAIYGFCFGAASFPILARLAWIQGFIGAWAFWSLMKWSNDGYQKEGCPKYHLDQKWVETIFGLLGTILYIFK